VRFLFLNQYFPPDPAPTGRLLAELADFLKANGHEIAFVSSRQNYRGAAKSGRRALRELAALASILWRGILTPVRPDVVVSASSPPLLLLAATLVAMRHRAKSAHWLFDMYPELAEALGEIQRGWFLRSIELLMGWSYRRVDALVGLDDDMLMRLARYDVSGETIAPWVIGSPEQKAKARSDATSKPALSTLLYSGNLGRAHEWETLLQTQLLLERRDAPWRLVFQGGGPAWPSAQRRAEALGLRNCTWKSYAPEEKLHDSLLEADVLAVTQRPETRGLLWPSKLAFVRTIPRRILWIGPTDGAVARELRSVPQAGVFAPGSSTEIAEWLQQPIAVTPIVTDPLVERARALKKWLALLDGLGD
jgi:hypothetical protein